MTAKTVRGQPVGGIHRQGQRHGASRSKGRRDQINAKVMADPRLKSMMDPEAMPFDSRRMFRGGFKILVDLAS